MNSQKLFLSILGIAAAVIMVMWLWENTLLLSLSLAILGLIKHKIIPIKSEFLWFVLSAIVGTAGESIVMLSGSWSYAGPHIFNFPLWLPFLWGVAGIIGISLYQSMTGV